MGSSLWYVFFSFFNKIEQADAIVFTVALSDYLETCYEDETKNRLFESLETFERISNNLPENTPLYLVLTKRDLFDERIRRHEVGTILGQIEKKTEPVTNETIELLSTVFKESSLKVSSPGERKTIYDIPSEAIASICLFLTAKDICMLGSVCYQAYTICNSDVIWQNMLLLRGQDMYPSKSTLERFCRIHGHNRGQEPTLRNIGMNKYRFYYENVHNKVFQGTDQILDQYLSRIHNSSQREQIERMASVICTLELEEVRVALESCFDDLLEGMDDTRTATIDRSMILEQKNNIGSPFKTRTPTKMSSMLQCFGC